MDFDYLFDENIDNSKSDVCNCNKHIRITVLVVTLLSLLIDYVYKYRETQKISTLTQENDTLKNIILKSVDRAFVKMMKNGNDSDNEDED